MLTVSHSLRTRETAPVAAVLWTAFVATAVALQMRAGLRRGSGRQIFLPRFRRFLGR